ncbi:hypothetical protein FE633_36605 [Streptomyces montanus]|uniref:Uncharacterized protein n=1 Tax=Streptomyces montanus TaxID=2580423 RepID=A0A5R9FGR3_9ACTN|nr:hypothetical protein FE633_36605 [Streptomyces montanus]
MRPKSLPPSSTPSTADRRLGLRLAGRACTHLVALVRAGARFGRGQLVERPETLASREQPQPIHKI